MQVKKRSDSSFLRDYFRLPFYGEKLEEDDCEISNVWKERTFQRTESWVKQKNKTFPNSSVDLRSPVWQDSLRWVNRKSLWE